MAGRCIAPSSVSGTGVPAVLGCIVKSGETFKQGALVVLDTNGLLVECGADPTTAGVLGIALNGASTSPGYDAANSPTVVTGRENICSVALGDEATTFSMRGVNGGTDPTTPSQVDVGDGYGALKDANGIWTLDLAETSAKIFTIVGVDIVQKVYFCRMISTIRQVP